MACFLYRLSHATIPLKEFEVMLRECVIHVKWVFDQTPLLLLVQIFDESALLQLCDEARIDELFRLVVADLGVSRRDDLINDFQIVSDRIGRGNESLLLIKTGCFLPLIGLRELPELPEHVVTMANAVGTGVSWWGLSSQVR
jgi:hypothetical protein